MDDSTNVLNGTVTIPLREYRKLVEDVTVQYFRIQQLESENERLTKQSSIMSQAILSGTTENLAAGIRTFADAFGTKEDDEDDE
mgnify:CR=1 FL=1